MKRYTMALLLVFGLLASFVVPGAARAETAVSCTTQYAACINAASEFRGSAGLQTLAETECGLEYEGCVLRKLKFW